MATNHPNHTWPVSDLTFVEVAIEHPIQKQMHVAFDCGTRIVISQCDQIPLAGDSSSLSATAPGRKEVRHDGSHRQPARLPLPQAGGQCVNHLTDWEPPPTGS